MPGFAVVDVETTGFAFDTTDRICEIGIVLLDPEGHVEDEYVTLVNPQRDLGAQRIHGIDATEARLAPTFDALAGDIMDLLRGRVLVAHNAAFDSAFLAAEFERVGASIDLRPDGCLCTMNLARALGAPASLAACCSYLGIDMGQHHSALADARAAAAVVTLYISQAPGTLDAWLLRARDLQWPETEPRRTPPVHRGVVASHADVFVEMAMRFKAVTEPVHGNEFLDLLARVVADGRISKDERRSLTALAEVLGLTSDDIGKLVRHYLLSVVEAALEDGVFTANERANVLQLAALFELSEEEQVALLSYGEHHAKTVDSAVNLKPGDTVVLTGMSEAKKRELTSLAESCGLVVWGNINKRVAVVVALDIGSNSGKARKAREYGIPVVSVEAFEEQCVP